MGFTRGIVNKCFVDVGFAQSTLRAKGAKGDVFCVCIFFEGFFRAKHAKGDVYFGRCFFRVKIFFIIFL